MEMKKRRRKARHERKQTLAKLRNNQEKEREKLAEVREIKAKIKRKRDKKAGADPERAEQLADQIEALRAEKARLLDRIEQLDAKQLKLKAVAKRLRKRIKRLTRKINKSKHYASPHFRYAEFDCRDGTPVPKAAYPALEHLCKNYLEPLRQKYGAVHINSGYRTRSYNASIGGASFSEHIYNETPGGVAADHTCSGASPSTVANFHDARNVGGLGRYGSFTHIDNRDRDGKPSARWWG